MNKTLRITIGILLIIISGVYFIPQEDISIMEFFITFLIISIGVMMIDFHKNKVESKEKIK